MIFSPFGFLNKIITVIPPAGYDADAQAFFDRVTAAGGTLNITEQDAVNTVVLTLKANSVWSLMTALYPMVGASAAACAQNLISADFTGTFSSGWTYASNGVTPNGTSAYFNTYFEVWPTQPDTDSLAFSTYINTPASIGSMQMGAIGGNNTQNMLSARWTSTTNYLSINGYGTTQQSELSAVTGFLGVSRTNSADFNYFKGNSLTATVICASVSVGYLYPMMMGASNGFGGSPLYYDTARICWGHMSSGLTDSQMTVLANASIALQVALSRQA